MFDDKQMVCGDQILRWPVGETEPSGFFSPTSIERLGIKTQPFHGNYCKKAAGKI